MNEKVGIEEEGTGTFKYAIQKEGLSNRESTVHSF